MSEYARQRQQPPKLEDLDPTGTLFEVTEEPEVDELEQRLDREADKLGSYVLARARLGIEEPESEDEPLASRTPRTKQRRYSRRGGRSYNEGSDSEHDPYWNAPTQPLMPEQREVTHRGIAEVRKIMEEAKPKDPTPEEIAARRAADAAEIRRKARESWGDSV